MATKARFHALQSKLKAATDREFAEPIKFMPLTDGRIDNTRAHDDFEAILRVNSSRSNDVNNSNSRGWRSHIAAGKGLLFIDPSKASDLKIKKGDKIKALSRQREPFFLVEHVNTRDQSRIIVDLSEA